MIDYPALAALAEIIRRGSFDAAASALGVTQPAISQRIKTLESRTGQVLLDRGPPVSATQAGLRLVAHFDQVRLLEQAVRTDLVSAADPATIRIAVNADSLASWAIEALPQAPGLLDLVIDDQEHAETWLRSGLVSAAITSQRGPVAGCDSHALGAMRYIACATPDFMARHFPNGVTADALGRAPAVTFNSKDGLQSGWVRSRIGRPVVFPTHLIPATEPFAQAVRLGMGWGMNPDLLIRDDLRSGRLMPLLPDAELLVPLYWQVTRIMAPALLPLTRAIRRSAQATLVQP
ncbi:LysR family transcriptional regulator ArgP [Paracoccus aerodenitrificans]|uniref:LysR family transcriptional regulator ArgP n=1 Tax=Paracoccus aerodenitrificans TaxID=3017781 RepID=UPI0022F11571|nr:LysR family transcriptional regulator ArgP [Paracoccus aerodenitrificans]WBU64586.1 LysR family transcriptional regulator ArgP [Paracoccus aerodenitrificans]